MVGIGWSVLRSRSNSYRFGALVSQRPVRPQDVPQGFGKTFLGSNRFSRPRFNDLISPVNLSPFLKITMSVLGAALAGSAQSDDNAISKRCGRQLLAAAHGINSGLNISS